MSDPMIPPPALDEIEKLAREASPGPWFSDGFKSEGTYGIGDETHEGFNSYAVYSENKTYFGKPAAICEASGDSAEIHEEFDEDSHSAWDEVGRRNMAYIAAVSPDRILALLSALRAAQADLKQAMQMVADKSDQYVAERQAHNATKAERDEAVEALEPFATFAGRFGDTARDDSWVLTRNPSGKGDLTMGDVRHARNVHTKLKVPR